MRGRNVGLVTVVLALAAVAAWWFAFRGDVASVDGGPAGDREAPGAIDPARREPALAGTGRAKPDGEAAAARRILGSPRAVEGASIRGVVVDGAGVGIAGARVVAIPDTVAGTWRSKRSARRAAPAPRTSRTRRGASSWRPSATHRCTA